MLLWLLKWTVCVLGLLTTSNASPDDASVDFGGESGSGMLQTGKIGANTCGNKYNLSDKIRVTLAAVETFTRRCVESVVLSHFWHVTIIKTKYVHAPHLIFFKMINSKTLNLAYQKLFLWLHFIVSTVFLSTPALAQRSTSETNWVT